MCVYLVFDVLWYFILKVELVRDECAIWQSYDRLDLYRIIFPSGAIVVQVRCRWDFNIVKIIMLTVYHLSVDGRILIVEVDTNLPI